MPGRSNKIHHGDTLTREQVLTQREAVTIQQAADHLGVSHKTVRRMIRRRQATRLSRRRWPDPRPGLRRGGRQDPRAGRHEPDALPRPELPTESMFQ